MPRYRKQNIELDEESLKNLLQESYKQACELRTKVISDATKTRRKLYADDMEDLGAVQIHSKTLIELIKAEQVAIEKKLGVARVIKDVIGAAKKIEDPEEDGAKGMTEGKKKEIQDMIKNMSNQ